ncbi:hypothetical protein J4460_08730 [Candidatus Woesearchaeota archaeon]|nr:MAG: hypothetical protein QS99_C0013G0047 [archaeon GW2011_AR4]MBS3130721.1 hypothetical protein [Candidatus Woesearchaeota archaeon]HIH38816.1 hypothetical protein [Candidatus Woesearchaeota archaeon]HIH48434.1 hypothetical protein [Candidatus Woesearchaeota archaeon]HIJ03813.1 hypothetical protein [Candidatus Woesearchaeota archaeon]
MVKQNLEGPFIARVTEIETGRRGRDASANYHTYHILLQGAKGSLVVGQEVVVEGVSHPRNARPNEYLALHYTPRHTDHFKGEQGRELFDQFQQELDTSVNFWVGYDLAVARGYARGGHTRGQGGDTSFPLVVAARNGELPSNDLIYCAAQEFTCEFLPGSLREFYMDRDAQQVNGIVANSYDVSGFQTPIPRLPVFMALNCIGGDTIQIISLEGLVMDIEGKPPIPTRQIKNVALAVGLVLEQKTGEVLSPVVD